MLCPSYTGLEKGQSSLWCSLVIHTFWHSSEHLLRCKNKTVINILFFCKIKKLILKDDNTIMSMSMSRRYAETLDVSQKAYFTRNFSKAYRGEQNLVWKQLSSEEIADTNYNLQDWENVKFNNLKFELPKPAYLTGYARKAELYLKHGILK